MSKFNEKRRRFLRNSVMASLLAPVAHFWDDIAEAQEIATKRHMVLVFLPNGVDATNPFVTDVSGDDFSLAPGYQPYNEFRDDMIVLDQYGFRGYCDLERLVDGAEPIGHVTNGAVLYSGAYPLALPSGYAAMTAPTVDQIVAWDYLDRGVITDPLRKTLNFKFGNFGSYKIPSIFAGTPADYTLGRVYDRPIESTPLTLQPQDAFDQMFGDFVQMAGGSADELRAFGRSILDVPSAELSSVRAQLPNEARLIVDQHLHSLRELEQSFASAGLPPTAELPDAPGMLDLSPTNHRQVWDHWVRLVDASLRFDRTRIVGIQFGGIASRFAVPELGLGFVGEEGDANSGADHHSYTHWYHDDIPLFMNWYAERISELLRTLQGDGTTENLLESSVVAVSTEGGVVHRPEKIPSFLFGSLGGHLNTGRRVVGSSALENYHMHTGMLLALAHGMGTTRLTTMGDASDPMYQQGPWGELLA